MPKISFERALTGAGLAALIILLFIVSFRYEYDSDFYWHLTVGKYFIETGRFLTHDIYSFTFPGKEWFNISWLFDSATYLLYARGGYVFLNVFRFLLLCTTYLLLYLATRTERRPHLLIFLAASLATLPLIRTYIFRPEMTMPLFIGYYLWALNGYKYRNTRLIWTVPLAQVIWTNTHGSFIFGLILIGIYFLGAFARALFRDRSSPAHTASDKQLIALACTGLLSALAVFINPYGLRIAYWLPKMTIATQEIREVMHSITEWAPLPLSQLLDFGLSDFTFLTISIWAAVICLIIKLRLSWKGAKNIRQLLFSFPHEGLILAALFALQAFQHSRFAFLAAFACAALIIPVVSSFDASGLPVKKLGYLVMPSIGLLVIFTLFSSYTLTLAAGPAPLRFPEEAAEFILKNKLSGSLLNEYNDGGYLIWTLYPHMKVFIDGRTVNVYDADFYWRSQNLKQDPILAKTLALYQPTAALLDNQSAVVEKLLASGFWRMVFFDQSRVLLVLDSPGNKEVIENHSYILLNPAKKSDIYIAACGKEKETEIFNKEIKQSFQDLRSPVYAALALANFVVNCDRSTQADVERTEKLLASFTYGGTVPSQEAETRYAHGSLLLKLNRAEDALTQFNRAFALHQKAEYAMGSGIALFNLDRYQDAEKMFERSALLVPFGSLLPAEYYRIYGRTLYYLDKNRRAVELIQRYLDLTDAAKHAAIDYLFLSKAYADNGDDKSSKNALEKARSIDPLIE